MTSCHQEDERKGRAKSCPPLDVDISTVEYRRYLFTELQTSLPLGIWPHHIASLMHEDDASITITNHFSTCQGCWILMHLYRWMFIDFHSEVLSTAVGSSLSRGDDEVGRRQATSISLVPTTAATHRPAHDTPTCRGLGVLILWSTSFGDFSYDTTPMNFREFLLTNEKVSPISPYALSLTQQTSWGKRRI